MTKRNKSIVDRYNRSSDYELYKCYPSGMSQSKHEAWEYCKELCKKHDGEGLKVISHNGYMFTAGFEYTVGWKRYLMYITKSANTPILLED